MKLRLKDIAKLANTTEATVSMVLNSRRYDQVSVETRKRVKSIANKVGYVPNRMAQMLARGKTEVVLILVTNLTNSFVNTYITKIGGYLKEKGYTLFPLATMSDTECEAELINWLPQRYFDGAICLEYDWHNQSCYSELDSSHPLVVRTWSPREFHCPFSHIDVDYGIGIENLFKHFLDYDRKHVGVLVEVSPECNEIDSENPRIYLYQRLLEKYGLVSPDDYWITASQGLSEQDLIYKKTKKLLMDNPEIDTMVLHNAGLCVPVYRAIKELGKEVGRDIAVAAFDDPAMVTHMMPSLTVVREPVDIISEQLANMLLNKMNKTEEQIVATKLSSELVIRDSTLR